MIMTIESKLISWLNANVDGWEAFGDIPEEKPEKFIIVERTGGPVDSVRIERPEVTISFFHKTSSSEAAEVAVATDIKLRAEIINDNSISKVERNSLVRLDDLIIKYPRYMAYYSFVHLL